MNQLIAVKSAKDILPEYQKTPIALLLEYHNFNLSFQIHQIPQLIIGTCVDNRIHLRVPPNFAYIARAGGANMRNSEFKISYAIALGNVKNMVLIGHNHCGMSNLKERKDLFIQGLIKTAGWSVQQAKEHFAQDSPGSEIGNEVEFILSETKRLRNLYPKIQIAPMMYLVEDNQLYLMNEK